jgi:hypothetical protein
MSLEFTVHVIIAMVTQHVYERSPVHKALKCARINLQAQQQCTAI